MYGEDCNQTSSFISIRECVFERKVALNHVLALYILQALMGNILIIVAQLVLRIVHLITMSVVVV